MNSKIFNYNYNHLFLEKWNSTSFNSTIRGENKEIIGKIISSSKGKREISLRNEDLSIILKASGRSWPRSGNWEIVDSDGQIIGRITKKSLLKKDMIFQNASEESILFSKGSANNYCINITDKEGNLVAEFLNKNELYIKKNQFDRKILFGLLLCIYYHLLEFTVRVEKFSQEHGEPI